MRLTERGSAENISRLLKSSSLMASRRDCAETLTGTDDVDTDTSMPSSDMSSSVSEQMFFMKASTVAGSVGAATGLSRCHAPASSFPRRYLTPFSSTDMREIFAGSIGKSLVSMNDSGGEDAISFASGGTATIAPDDCASA